jgi:hypothetical protein
MENQDYQLLLIDIQKLEIDNLLINDAGQHIAYLGCSTQYFKEYIEKKFTKAMSWKSIVIEEIELATNFNLNDPNEFLKCSNYKNYKPVLKSRSIKYKNRFL